MKRLRIYPYKMASESASLIRHAIKGSLRVFGEGAYRPTPNTLLLCWGATRPKWARHLNGCTVLNHWDNLSNARDKRLSHALFKEHKVSGPKFVPNQQEARKLLAEGLNLVQYMSATGQGGAGVRFIDAKTGAGFNPNAQLWTVYIKKQAEYRVHVFCGKVIDVTQKARKKGEEADSKIRNIDHGWIFKRHGIIVPEDVRTQAVAAVAALGLDFGGVDVIWNEHSGKAYVLEVNSAPGIEGTTLEMYVNAIREQMK